MSVLSQNSLNGQCLRIIWLGWEGNPKGLSGPLKGGLMVEYLANRFNFTYEWVRATENAIDPSPKGKGLLSYLVEKEIDLLVHGIGFLPPHRFQQVDITLPWYYGYFGLLIPVPEISANYAAIFKPFQWPVWMLIAMSIICIAILLSQLLHMHFLEENNSSLSTKTYSRSKGLDEKLLSRRIKQPDNSIRNTGRNAKSQFLYAFGLLLSQGGHESSKRLAFRIVAGVWAVAVFVIVQAYCSVLFTFVITPSRLPLINSVSDIVDAADINVLVRKGGVIEYNVLGPNVTETYRKLGERLNAFPQSKCVVVSDCVNFIKPGLKNVFMEQIAYLMDIIKAEYKKTGQCSMQVAREPFEPAYGSFALQKNSPFTKTISQGLLEIQEIGLLDYWETQIRRMPGKCLKNIKSDYKNPKTEKHKTNSLTLKNLSGSFITLAIGIGLSSLAFFYEKVAFCVISKTR